MLGKFSIFIAYFRCFTLVRAGNYILLKTSYFLSLITGKSIRWGKAFAVTFETVGGCNLQCPGCELGSGMLKRPSGFMDIEHFFLCLNKLPSTVFHINLHFQGEPLLHPKIAEFIRLARQRKFFVTLSTNGQLLQESTSKELVRAGLSHIIISLDGYDQESYSKYRKGGHFDKVLTNIRNLSRLKKLTSKKFPVIEVQTVIFKSNENKLSFIKKLAFQTGADMYSTKTAYVPLLKQTPDYLPDNVKFQRYNVQDDGSLSRKKKSSRFCFRMRSSCVVLNDLSVVSCCFDKNGDVILGNLLTDDFDTIHHGKIYKSLSDSLLSGNAPGMCKNCI
jgi:MoaA/NifB/PqqE/SkfB family radical SAM enzyme